MVKVRERETEDKKQKLKAFENAADKTPTNEDIRPNAPRKYKSITIHFNRYEFDRITEECEETGQSKLSYIRQAINTKFNE